MRDMLGRRAEPYPLTAWSGQFQRIREDLDAALKLEESFSPAARTADPTPSFLSQSPRAIFGDAVDRMFELAGSGQRKRSSRSNTAHHCKARQAAPQQRAVSRLLGAKQ